ncbi:MAG: Fic family protein [Gammaproteobacteria bacterium]|nr:Fic family protein [Gammaproteobacteria bacterium]
MSNQLTQDQYVLLTAKRALADLVHNMSSAEGNPITITEVVTLLDGITVGGHKVSDQNQVFRLDSAWTELFRLVESDQFELTKRIAIGLNELVATDEAPKVGAFRDDQVGIQGVEYIPPHHATLDRKFNEMLEDVNQRHTALERAVTCFTICARNQFFFDGNKRTSQLLMNSILLSNGQHVITIPAKDRNQYFYLLKKLYDSNDSRRLAQFLRDRQLDKIMKVREREQHEQDRKNRD